MPRDIHARLRHLALDLRQSLGDVMLDAVVLKLRYHDRGDGLPEPQPPADGATGHILEEGGVK